MPLERSDMPPEHPVLPPNSQPSPLPTSVPRASDILHSLKDADNPLDFIRNNIRQETALNPEAMSAEVAATREAASQLDNEGETQYDEPVASDADKPAEKAQTPDTQGEDTQSPESTEEIDDDDLPDESALVKGNAAENFKKLRTLVKETKGTLKEREKTLQQTQAELERYKSGEVLPDELLVKEQRIAELEKYEKIVNVKASPYYREKFVRPLNEIKSKVKAIAVDYQIPEDVMNRVFNITNRAELNGFLSDHFDEVGALEVKQLLNQARELQDGAQEALKEPDSAMEQLLQEAERIQHDRKVKQVDVISRVSKDAWTKSLLDIRSAKKVVELIPRAGDEAFNAKYIDPIVGAAATEYGKIVSMLAANGLESLPADLAYALAQACQLGHASAVAIQSRHNALRHAEELENNTRRTTSYVRPSLGGGGRGSDTGRGGPISEPLTPKAASEAVLRNIGVNS